MLLDWLPNRRNAEAHNLIVTPDWQYCEYQYDIYKKSKHSEYKSRTVYYSVMATELPRHLPNVVFDSFKARKRQFRFNFSRDQRHSLEGDFDKHFATYFPVGYTIDSMSFISPDVMWAMRSADDYDIEIVGNRLFLYGPLYDPSWQLPDMSAKIMTIKKELLDNIVTYRDERLPYAEGRERVTAGAMRLTRSRFWARVSFIGIILYVVLRFGWAIYDSVR
jgi:hypothetical protein